MKILFCRSLWVTSLLPPLNLGLPEGRVFPLPQVPQHWSPVWLIGCIQNGWMDERTGGSVGGPAAIWTLFPEAALGGVSFIHPSNFCPLKNKKPKMTARLSHCKDQGCVSQGSRHRIEASVWGLKPTSVSPLPVLAWNLCPSTSSLLCPGRRPHASPTDLGPLSFVAPRRSTLRDAFLATAFHPKLEHGSQGPASWPLSLSPLPLSGSLCGAGGWLLTVPNLPCAVISPCLSSSCCLCPECPLPHPPVLNTHLTDLSPA